ncbi:hypothetical protein SASPL_111879 [Salvia splendens]|uniref:Uncharacterized protein n=1 Tax=Salvia splendens TaxID=180675 RepID=A0A8X9A420_SALSN|nr:hypothetical protein SASPL_111879 [Salvia splendens]
MLHLLHYGRLESSVCGRGNFDVYGGAQHGTGWSMAALQGIYRCWGEWYRLALLPFGQALLHCGKEADPSGCHLFGSARRTVEDWAATRVDGRAET